MASQRAESGNRAIDAISQMQSSINGSFSGNTGNHNVFGNGNFIWSIQVPRDMTELGGVNEGQGVRVKDGEPGEEARPYWMVPYCRNNAFTGRETVIESISEVCKSGTHNRIALHGLGGCGKTQIALEYVFRRSSEGHCDVFWVQGSGILKFTEGFKGIAQHVQIPQVDTVKDEEELLRHTRTWFEGRDSGDWILVIDNADNDADFIGNSSPIAKFVPQGRGGTVIFTTRSRQVAIREGCKVIKVGKMEPEDALELFSKRFDSWHGLGDEERGAVSRILDSVDHLPLAVVGSAAFMAENGTSPSVYWSIFQENDKRAKELLSEQFCDIQREVDMTESILGTYFITFDTITEQTPLMTKLLAFIASLDRENIPAELLTHSGLEGMDDSHKFCQAIGKLLRFSLATEVKHEGTTFYELHRLVQLSIQAYLPIEQANQGRAAGLQAVSRLFPKYEYKRRNICAAYMSHALVLTKDSTDTVAEDLIFRMGWYYIDMGSCNDAGIQACRCLALREAGGERDWGGERFSRVSILGVVRLCQGRYKEAEVIFLKLLKEVENGSGLNHPNTLSVVSHLAVGLREQGRYEESEVMSRRVLEGYEKCFGSDHPNTLMAFLYLAQVLVVLGKYEESEVMNRRALEGYEKCFGSDHPTTFVAANTLAAALRAQGRYEESEAMNRRALVGYDKCFGSDHPKTLTAVDNLAQVLREQGRYDESEVMGRRVLEGYEKCVGSDHPNTLMAANNLALVLREQGRYGESEAMGHRALQGCEKVFGSGHPSTLAVVNQLGTVLLLLGKYDESEAMNRRASEGYEKCVGSHHPNTLMAVSNLALVLREQQRYEESEEMSRRALGVCEKFFGLDNPNTLLVVNNLASVLLVLERYNECEAMNRRALEGYKKCFGPDHPNTLATVNNLAAALLVQGRYEESEVMYRCALEGYEKCFGSDHPNALMAIINLAVVLREQGKYEESEVMNRRALEGYEKSFGSDHPDTLKAVENLSILLQKQRRFIESETLSRRALEARGKTLRADHPSLLFTIDNLTIALEAQGKSAETEELLQRALTTHESALGPEHPNVCKALESLACLHEKQDRYSQAEEAYERAYRGFSKTLGEQHLTTLECSRKLKLLQERQPSSERISRVEGELGASAINHWPSHSNSAFLWLETLSWYPRNLWKWWSS